MVFQNALQLRKYLKSLSKNSLKTAEMHVTYSDDVESGTIEAGMYGDNDRGFIFEVVGSSEDV